MRSTITALVAVTILALAGCGDNAAPEEPEPTGSAAPVASPTPETATVQQWASLIAPLARNWRDLAAEQDEVCLDPQTVTACHLNYLNFKIQSETIILVIDGAAHNPNHPDYLGEPPAEIQRLVEDTLEAAEQVTPAWEAYDATGCGDPFADSCRGEGFRMRMAVDNVTRVFDAWEPYL